MGLPRPKYREDYWFIGGLLLALVFGIIAGSTLNILFLVAVSFLLAVVWIGTFFYIVFDKPGPYAATLFFAILIFLVSTWLTVIVSVSGFLR